MPHGVGRIQRQVRRCLIAAGALCGSTSWCDGPYAGNRRPWRWPIYQALKRYGVNVGRGLWAPNAELAALIGGPNRGKIVGSYDHSE